jgi:hypothetical protein
MYTDNQKFGKPYKFKVFVENELKGINRNFMSNPIKRNI